MEKYFRRTWVEVNLDALKHNYCEIESRLAEGSSIMAVVKADAYGHGVENAVREFSACGCRWFAVSNLEEALQVRSINGDCSILILGYTPAKYAQTLAEKNISQAVFDSEYACNLSQAAQLCDVQVKIHIKVDTGMSRLGFFFHDSVGNSDSVEEIAAACRLPGLYPEGIFTHFASADEEEGETFTRHQHSLFMTAIDLLDKKGIVFPLRHCCNSAATVLYPEMHLDLVRPGIILYGLMPSSFLRGAAPSSLLQGKIELKPALKMKTVVSMVKTIPEGTPVSYGRTYQADRDIKIATVPIGYADGYPRVLSGKAELRIGDRLVPVIGRICMDQCMLDVSGIENIGEGISVTVFDSDPNSPLSVDALAKKAATINYELICGINKRVPRVYTRQKEIEAIVDYMK
ncbi:MAG: alanine racemase [Clostridia bacterium]|nr:alanine racemase [Clostridia bacterium]